MNSISQSHQSHLTASSVSSHSINSHVGLPQIESRGLDFHEWSPALHVLLWVPVGTCFPSYHRVSQLQLYILFRNSALYSLRNNFPKLSLALTEHSSHNTHLTQHSQVMFLQYCDYLLVFFLRKFQNILGKVLFLLFVSVNIVINLFVSIL